MITTPSSQVASMESGMVRPSRYIKRVKPPSHAWKMRLYVANGTPKCLNAAQNIQRLCDQYLPNLCQIEVIDILARPQVARSEGIVAVPTLVCHHTSLTRRLVGDLSDTRRVIQALGLELKVP